MSAEMASINIYRNSPYNRCYKPEKSIGTSGSWKLCPSHCYLISEHLHLFFTPFHYAHGTLIRQSLWPTIQVSKYPGIHEIRAPPVGVKLKLLYGS